MLPKFDVKYLKGMKLHCRSECLEMPAVAGRRLGLSKFNKGMGSCATNHH